MLHPSPWSRATAAGKCLHTHCLRDLAVVLPGHPGYIRKSVVGSVIEAHNDNTKQIHSMPKQVHMMRVGLHKVIKSAEDQADLCTPKVYSKHNIVHGRDVE